MTSAATKQTQAELRFRVKRWLAVMAANIEKKVPSWGEIDRLIADNPQWARNVKNLDPNDPLLIDLFKRGWRD